MEEQAKKSVLFLSIHNACRSQFAEGLLKHFGGDRFEAFSAGVDPIDVDLIAVQVMQEVGVDINKNENKPVSSYNERQFDIVVTICSSASEDRPSYLNGTKQLSWDVSDPSQTKGSEQEILDAYRKVRDEILQQIRVDILNAPLILAS